MIIFTRLSLFVKRLARRVRRVLCSINLSKNYDAKEELMEAGLLVHENTLHMNDIKSRNKNEHVDWETRTPSIQMSPIDAPKRSPQKHVKESNLIESTQIDNLIDASMIKDTIRHLLTNKYGVDKQKLATIIRMHGEHKENGLEGPVLIDPIKLLID